ncbi:hypothetical protein M422DRAFT_60377 [Sphaerobolus stellatus SS14]|uniref:Uncharacterized protein n=1 Tax=Sphaerobolus stellatus (strain SS14) TaxID=990650 RepID=A0A0C9V5T9_SPHS4|nr:hypothetical protein M422DRAFT_60377 [Sphaerobolus stellatus SS14]
MHTKGHNAYCPCRACRALGVRAPAPPGKRGGNPYYIPFRRPPGYPAPAYYDPRGLPLRNHSSFLCQAEKVTNAPTQAESGRLAKYYGIKSVSIMSKLSSLTFPHSFPYDFMHLLENIMEILVPHWTGDFKKLDAGSGSFEIPKSVWDRIGEATASSNNTIPSAFGRRLLNIAEDRTFFTAEAWLVWTTLLGPELLQGRMEERYYQHFLRFVELFKLTISFEYTLEDVHNLKENWAAWLEDYEK